MARWFLMIAGFSGALAVALGAFGAHLLRAVLPLQMMTIFETAVRYHLLHTLALLATALLARQIGGTPPLLRVAGWLFVAGIILFPGSLYALTMSDIRMLGLLTPVGGLCWITAWLCLALHAWRSREAASG